MNDEYKKREEQIEMGMIPQPGPRVTQHDIDEAILGEHYFTASQGVIGGSMADGKRISDVGAYGTLNQLTFCVLVLKNGFTVTGESACVSASNFDAGYGRKLARDKAIDKLWAHMGFALADRIYSWRNA